MSRFLKTLLIHCCAFQILVATCKADLFFPIIEKIYYPDLGQKYVHASYEFINKSNNQIKIINVNASCGCTVAESEKKLISPEEEGEVKVKFDLSKRSGKQIKSIIVEYELSDQSVSRDILKIVVFIPKRIQLSHDYLSWKKQDARFPKHVLLSVHSEIQEHRTVSVKENNNFDVEVNLLSEYSKQYFLKISPLQSTPIATGIRCVAHDSNEGEIVVHLK